MSAEIIRIMCPNLSCKRVLAVPVQARGKIVRCSRCGVNIRIPAPRGGDDAKGGTPHDTAEARG